MEILLPMLVIVAVGAVVAVLALRRAGPAERPGGGRVDDDVTHWDRPVGGTGAPSPRRHGKPVPGSAADRARHGKP